MRRRLVSPAARVGSTLTAPEGARRRGLCQDLREPQDQGARHVSETWTDDEQGDTLLARHEKHTHEVPLQYSQLGVRNYADVDERERVGCDMYVCVRRARRFLNMKSACVHKDCVDTGDATQHTNTARLSLANPLRAP